jgi:tRNA A-37 threonylcarbamoyl transferase component Bud32
MMGNPDASRIGETVGGKYRIVRLLARGGMGVVYEALHAVVRRRFAIKFLRRDLAERRESLNRFQREAEAAGALENENVTASVDFGISDDGAPYIVMEYLVGENLADLLAREGRLPVERAADLVAQACRGVAAAHAAGIIHRDLKPHNLFVARRDDGTDLLKVLDFGVAKLQAIDEAAASTRTGTVVGTAAYMSPEQARGEKLVDQRADVYGLGAILYELVSAKRPHPGESQNAILHHIATQPAVPLASVQPELPAALIEIVGRMLASDPAARPPSADAVAQALAPFARREVWPARPDDSGQLKAALMSTAAADLAEAAIPASARVTPPTGPGRGPAPQARGRGRLVAAGVLAAVAIGVTIAVRSASPPALPPAPPPAAPAPAAAVRDTAPVIPVAHPAASPPPAATPDGPAAAREAPRDSGRPGGHRSASAGRPAPHPTSPVSNNPPAPASPPPEPRSLQGPTFDSDNPYK